MSWLTGNNTQPMSLWCVNEWHELMSAFESDLNGSIDHSSRHMRNRSFYHCDLYTSWLHTHTRTRGDTNDISAKHMLDHQTVKCCHRFVNIANHNTAAYISQLHGSPQQPSVGGVAQWLLDVGLWLADFSWSTYTWSLVDVWPLRYGSTNQANSTFHPAGYVNE